MSQVWVEVNAECGFPPTLRSRPWSLPAAATGPDARGASYPAGRGPNASPPPVLRSLGTGRALVSGHRGGILVGSRGPARRHRGAEDPPGGGGGGARGGERAGPGAPDRRSRRRRHQPPPPPRRGGLREERSRGVGRRKREPGPAGCERAEERNATDCQAGRGGRGAEIRERGRRRRPPAAQRAEAGAAAASAREPGTRVGRGPGRARRGRPWLATCRVSSRPTAARRRSSCRRTKMCWSATKVRPGPGPGPGARWEPESAGGRAAAAWPSKSAAGGAAGRGRAHLSAGAGPWALFLRASLFTESG